MTFRLVKPFLKGNKKLLMIELFLFLGLFLISFSSYIFFIDSYRKDWNNLLTTDIPTDLTININEPFTIFSITNFEIKNHLEEYAPTVLIKLPPSLFSTKYMNDTFYDREFIACDQKIFSQLGLEEYSSQVIFISDSTNMDKQAFEINFIPIIGNNTLQINTVLSITEFNNRLNTTSLLFNRFFTKKSIFTDNNTTPLILLSIDHLHFLLSEGERAIINDLTEFQVFQSFYHFIWDGKINYINSLPRQVLNAYRDWVKTRIDIFYDIYYPNFVFFTGVSIHTDLIFENSLNDLTSEHFSSLLSSFVIFVFLVGFLMTFFFFYLKQQLISFTKDIELFISKGAKEGEIKQSFLFIHSLLLVISIFLSMCMVFILANSLGFISWSYFYLVFSYVLGVNIIISLILEFQIVQLINKTLFKVDESITKKTSSSNKFQLTLETIITILLSLSSILFLSTLLINPTNKSKFIEFTGIALIFSLSILLIFLGPRLIRKVIYPFFGNLFSKQPRENKYIKKACDLSFNIQKNLWTILFLVFFLSTFFISFYVESNRYVYIKEETDKLYDLSIRIYQKYLNNVTSIFENSSYCSVYHISSRDVRGQSFIFLLDSPLSFFSGANFFHQYFDTYSNEEVFSRLNSTVSYVITDSETRKRLGFVTGEEVSFTYSTLNASGTITKKFLDSASFLPFISTMSHSFPFLIMAYHDNSSLITSDTVVSFNVKINNDQEKDSALRLLDSQNIPYRISTPNNYDTKQIIKIITRLSYPFYFIIAIIPIISLSFVFFVSLSIKKHLQFLEIRGLNTARAWLSTTTWLSFLICINLTVVITIVFTLQILLWKLLSNRLIMPFTVSYKTYLMLIFSLLSLSFISYKLFTLRHLKINIQIGVKT